MDAARAQPLGEAYRRRLVDGFDGSPIRCIAPGAHNRATTASKGVLRGTEPPAVAPVFQIGASAIVRFEISAHRWVFTSSTGGVIGMLGERNYIGLTEDQIKRCIETWAFLCDPAELELDASEAARHGTRTRYDETRRAVILGADAYPGRGQSANARLSMRACLAHELAHMLRAARGFKRPLTFPDVHLDEAETSIYASFLENIWPRDREDLVEDARDRLIDWLAFHRE